MQKTFLSESPKIIHASIKTLVPPKVGCIQHLIFKISQNRYAGIVLEL